jgi:hypothetical protein
MWPSDEQLQSIVAEAITIGDVESAAIFAVDSGSAPLRLVAAAGISGPPLDGLIAAVQDPGHPIARAIDDLGPTFDVRPMNPGGPALRSHLPLRTARGSAGTLGVLAVAHGSPTTQAVRHNLLELAGRAADLLEA